MAGKKGMNQPSQNRHTRDAKALANLENWIDQILEGHITCVKCRKAFKAKELQPSAVALLKARYDKLRPSLSAVEQTNVNPEDKKTEAQIINDLREIVRSNPDLIKLLLSEGQECGVNAESAAQHGDIDPLSSNPPKLTH